MLLSLMILAVTIGGTLIIAGKSSESMNSSILITFIAQLGIDIFILQVLKASVYYKLIKKRNCEIVKKFSGIVIDVNPVSNQH